MKLSETNRHSLLLAIHQSIEEQAAGNAKALLQGQVDAPVYPPNGGFTTEEKEALKLLQNKEVLQTALRKVLADCAAGVVFDLLNLIDGTIEPAHGDWTGVLLADKPRNDEEHQDFLHDEFFDSYWNWREIRPDKSWCLDTFSE